MKGQELFDRLQNFGNLDPETEQVISWLDTFQKDMAAELPPTKRVVLTDLVAGTEVPLPVDFLSVNDLLDDQGTWSYASDIIVSSDNYLRVPYDAVSLTLIYNCIPADVESLDDELVIHPMLQPLGFYFLVAMYYDKEGEGDEESAMGARWMQNYEYKKARTIAQIQSKFSDAPVKMACGLPKYSRTASYEEDDYYE